MARVCVGIVTYNSVSDLPDCFAALAQQTHPEIRVMVLDNASADESVTWVRQSAPECQVIVNRENVGFGRAHNQLVEAAALQPGEFYMTLNPDASLMPNYIEQLVRVMQDAHIGWAGGKLLLKDEHDHPTNYIYSAGQGVRRDGYVVNIGEGMEDAPIFNQPREVFAVSGAALMFRQETIQSIAPTGTLFDEQMFMYDEDIDAGWRARLQGWHCWYVPSAIAYHRGGRLNAARRGQALGNTYRSVLKNAYWIDLILYNLPLIAVNLVMRMLVSPTVGLALVRQLGRNARTAFSQRQPAKVSRAEMLTWYQWSNAQPTGQATGLLERIQRYLHKNRQDQIVRPTS